MLRLVSEATESTSSVQLIVAALRVSALSTEGILPRPAEASRTSFTPERVPVSPSAIVSPRTVERTAPASPTTVEPVVPGEFGIGRGGGGGNGKPPNWAKAPAGRSSAARASRIVLHKRGSDSIRCIQINLLE